MDCWVQVTSGRGPAECCYAALHVMQLFSKEAVTRKLKINTLEIIEGPCPGTIKSALISLQGNDIPGFLKTWEGTIQWIGQSPFRPKHKRKNWFVGIHSFTPPEETVFSKNDVKIETMKASGPGGQHVNKSNTAVRITHLPSRLVAIAQEERSQYMNKKLALARLVNRLENSQQETEKHSQQEQWEMHHDLERGNPVKVFQGPKFKSYK